MTELEKLKRIEIYESLGLSQDEIEWRLKKDEHLEDDSWWEFIRDQKFTTLDDLPDDAVWVYSSIEEELTEKCYNAELNESNKITEINPGDIVLVSKFINQSEDTVDNTSHRLVVIGSDGKNNIHNRNYFGYYMSSQKEKANKYNKKYPKNIYINDYNSILKSGMKSNQHEVFINLSGASSFAHDNIITVVGHISSEFETFLNATARKIYKKEDTSNVFWEK